MSLTTLWVEQYKPKSLADVIFANAADRAIFERYIKTASIPNLLLVGVQGTGKTSLSNALLNDLKILPEDRLRINCSDEKIDAMREKVKVFAYTMPMGAYKVVQLEEMDYLSLDAQALLRSLIEEVSESCRFICTANYLNKILPAIRSRTQEFIFSKPDRDEVLLRAADVLDAEKINYDVDDLEKVVAAGYPDIRKVLQLLESGSGTGQLLIVGEGVASDWKLGLLPLLESGDLKAARKLVCETASREELQDVYEFLYNNLHRVKKLTSNLDQAIITIAQYQYQHTFVSDGEIQIAAMFIELAALAK